MSSNPAKTVAVIFGAHQWPHDETFHPTTSFETAAHDFFAYLVGKSGLAIPVGNVCNLFDDERSQADLRKIGVFLQDRRKRLGSLEDLLLYYVGHGEYGQSSDAYYFIIRSTDTVRATSAISAEGLAATLHEHARGVRIRFFIDACYAAGAAKSFHSLIKSHIVLFCSSDARTRSQESDGRGSTMFTGAVLSILQAGVAAHEGPFHLHSLYENTHKIINERHGDAAVPPVIQTSPYASPDGLGLERLPFFPNPIANSRVTDTAKLKSHNECAIGNSCPRSTIDHLFAANRLIGEVVEEALGCIKLNGQTVEVRELVARIVKEGEAFEAVAAEYAQSHDGTLISHYSKLLRALRQFDGGLRFRVQEVRCQVDLLLQRIKEYQDRAGERPK